MVTSGQGTPTQAAPSSGQPPVGGPPHAAPVPHIPPPPPSRENLSPPPVAAAPPPRPSPPPPPLAPPDRGRRWHKSKAPPWIVAALAMFVAVGSASYLLLLPGHDETRPEAQKFVALYVTDLPGDVERLRFGVAAASVGAQNHPLRIDQADVEISRLRGPGQAERVASGYVPASAEGRVNLIFSGAEAYRGGAWEPVRVERDLLTIDDALAPGRALMNRILWDFDLPMSVKVEEDRLAFEPHVTAIYRVTDDATTLPPATEPVAFPVEAKVEAPQQRLADASEILRDMTKLSPTGSTPLGPTTTLSIAPTTSKTTGGYPTTSTPTTTPGPNPPPNVPSDPVPPNGTTGLGSTVDLAWNGGDPEGQPVTYTVVVNGETRCQGITTPACTVSGLAQGSTHKWRVIAQDASGQITTGPSWGFATGWAPQPASNPSPPNGSTGQPTSLRLSWQAGADPDASGPPVHRVWMGVSGQPMNVACNWSTNAYCDVAGLSYNTLYAWRVESSDGVFSTLGPSWSFAVGKCAVLCGSP